MRDAPIPLIMNLWALGHSQGQIATMVGASSRKVIERIIAKARSIGDRRAVRHANGSRVLGKAIPREKRLLGRKKRVLDGIEVVPIIHKATCIHGHPRLGNVDRGGHCLTCWRKPR